jgi:hypothetical protein
MSAVKPLEYTQSQLTQMKREDLEAYALSEFNIAGHLHKNKSTLILAVMEAQGNTPEGGLTERQEEFCQLFATDREFFGNGTQSYIEAYDVSLGSPGAYDAARSSAADLLMNPNILSRISEIMEVVTFNDVAMDRQLAFWATQKAHPMAAVQAIKEYNRVKKRVDDKGALVGLALTQNNFSVSITEERGQKISQQVTDYVLEITKAPQTGSNAADAPAV